MLNYRVFFFYQEPMLKSSTLIVIGNIHSREQNSTIKLFEETITDEILILSVYCHSLLEHNTKLLLIPTILQVIKLLYNVFGPQLIIAGHFCQNRRAKTKNLTRT
jgi:hypothetical protein